jgi:FkbH-like protein
MGFDFSGLLKEARESIRAARFSEAFSIIASAAIPGLDSTETTQLVRLLKNVPSPESEKWFRRSVRIAILSSSTTAHLRPFLEFFFFTKRIKLDLWLSDYSFEAAIAARDPELAAFKPEICLVSGNFKDIEHWPDLSNTAAEYRANVDRELSRWTQIQNSLREWLGVSVLQEGFFLPPERPLGHFEDRGTGGRVRFIQDLNQGLKDQVVEKTIFVDIDYEAARIGRTKWFDRRWWYEAKYAVSPECTAAYCHRIAAVVGSIYGLTKKCLVLDLDNTLWGGVIGDDGLSGITFGEGSGAGEAHKAFQVYVKSLKRQGVLLAVCSKNDEATALEPFLKNAEFPLKLEDFDVFVANWSPKGENIAAIARKLNIGLDSLVFFDDNPAERAQVHLTQPEVFVVEGVDDPSDFIDQLDTLLLFEAHQFTREDAVRGELYAADRTREAMALAAPNYETYLENLRMVGSSVPFSPADLARITQLINKTNQFNLTTRRYTEEECARFSANSKVLTRAVRLQDKFGDNGLISAFIGKVTEGGKTLDIDTWVMSCRVMRRGLEHFLIQDVLREAEARGIQRILGTYLPTDKNKMVSDLYSQLGFRLSRGPDNGATVWEMVAPFTFPTHQIERA